MGLPLTSLLTLGAAIVDCRYATKPATSAFTASGARAAPPLSMVAAWKERVADDSIETQSGHLADGLVVSWQSSFPKNELADSVRVRGGFLARTTSGNLVRVDEQLRLLRVARFFPPLTALAPAGGEVWAGTEDGGVMAIDPEDLSAREIARVDGVPQWIGARAAGTKPPAPVVLASGMKGAGPLVLDAARGLEWPIHAPGTSAFFLDGRERLWLGGDHGEWGGTLAWLDLTSGQLHTANNTPLDGIYGIGQMGGGPVLEWGGTDHMGFGRAVIGEVDPRKTLFESKGGSWTAHKPVDRPGLPITQMVDEGDDGKAIAVFAFDGVFRTDPSFQSWTKLGTLDVHYSGGRPDAVGSYPAVRAVHVLGRGHFVLATRLDGYIEFEEGRCISRAFAGDVPVRAVNGIWNTADGLLFTGDEGAPSFWYRAGRWEEAHLDPPMIEGCGDFPGGCPEHWSERRAVVAPDGTLFTVSGTNEFPGPRAFTRWHAERPEIVGRSGQGGAGEDKLDVPQQIEGVFVTPDGTFWYASDVVARFAGDHWQVVSTRTSAKEWLPWGLRAVNSAGPPWILVSDYEGAMLRLSYERGFQNVRLESMLDRGAASDALALDGERILVASNEGLQVYASEPGILSKWTGPAPDGQVLRLARDRRGRIWMGGEGLWLLDANDKQIHSLASLDITSAPVTALAADPTHDDGVILVTATNEVAFVQANTESDGR